MAPSFDFHQVLPGFFREAEDFIRAQNPSTPFFLYLPLPAPHTPWMPVGPWSGRSAAGEYGDFVEQLDASVGRLMATLDSMGMRDNTIVVFTSDNGPYWRSDYISKYGHRSAGPFRGMKGDAFEGGHRVPFIVRWTGRVAPGSVSAATTTLANLMATVVDITGTHDRKYAVEDSYSILPVLTGKDDRVKGQPAVVHHSSAGMFALRMGDWKLIDGLGSGGFTVPRFVKQQPGGPAMQLFNLRDDPGETHDLAGEHPEKVAELRAMLERIRSAGERLSD
jgi:arylsulfatase A-like enzyme